VTSLTIQGQTTVNCTGTVGTSTYTCAATDNTVISDSYNILNASILTINTGSSSTAFRMTGLTFQGGTVSAGVAKYNGFILFHGSSQNFRLDHCHFNAFTYSNLASNGGVTTYDSIMGVFDHNLFEMYSEGNAIRDYGGGDYYGDTTWAQPSAWGSSNFIFAENNVFNKGAANDCNYGARMVIRYNTILDNPYSPEDEGLWQGHQTGQGEFRTRGCRALEIYHNYIYNNSSILNRYGFAAGNLLAATGMAWANIVAGYKFDVVFSNARTAGSGHTQQDVPTSVGYCGNGSNGNASPWDGNSNSQGYPCLNQTGRGQGDLLSGNFPSMTNTTTGCTPSAASSPSSCSGWPHNKREPWYVWNESQSDILAGGGLYGNPIYSGVQMQPNRDFYVQVSASSNTTPSSPFNGTSGTGFGTLVNRPTTCTAGPGGIYDTSPTGSYGVAYFATDNQTLYVCTTTNTWNAIYTPYAYPHPLVIGGTTNLSGNVPVPPTGLTATVQ
jgi:hypothetical protein